MVIAVAVASVLPECEIWVAFGHGNKLRYILHLLCSCLGVDASWGLLFFHALTGCDVCSAFHGIGKKNSMDCTQFHATPSQTVC